MSGLQDELMYTENDFRMTLDEHEIAWHYQPWIECIPEFELNWF